MTNKSRAVLMAGITLMMALALPVSGDAEYALGMNATRAAHTADDEIPETERILAPIAVIDIPGRFGSLWRSILWIRNSADVPVLFAAGAPFSSLPDGGLVKFPPGVTAPAGYLDNPVGLIYRVEKAYTEQIHLSLRIADVNRRPVSQGTELPVVHESDWLEVPVELLDIPTEFSVRQTLRVYDPEATNAASVRVTIYPLMDNEPLLAELNLELRGGSDRTINPMWYSRPSYAEIPDLVAMFPQIAASESVRIRIEPLTPGLRYWAFVAITDNMTQQVTVVTPQ